MTHFDSKIAKRFFGELQRLAPGIEFGILIGTVIALVLPTLFVLAAYSRERASLAFAGGAIGRTLNPWVDTLIRPHLFLPLIIVLLLILLALQVHKIKQSLIRCYTATVTDTTVLWSVCAFSAWTDSRWKTRVLVLTIAVLISLLIAGLRLHHTAGGVALINADRPVTTNADDELDRSGLINLLVQRLTSDELPVIALVGAYGDGKTSIMNMLVESLSRHNVTLVRFKTSLPGNESTLVSTLFNSISKELQKRFFVHRLGGVFSRYARLLIGIVPSVPAGLKDVFGEPSQQEDLDELTERLRQIPVKRVIVLLDDMDRMQSAELQALLKIIRGVEDYPKLSFVCAFNKNALVEALVRQQAVDRIVLYFSASQGARGPAQMNGTISGEVSADDMRSGFEYLEKFFPVQIPVPKLDEKQLAKQFDARFGEFTEHYGLLTLPDEQKTFQQRFEELWLENFRPALSNVRKLKTYFNALKLSFALVKDEVDLIDFMCVELLRETEPSIYEHVFKNRRLFYYPAWDVEHWPERVDISEQRGRELHKEAFDNLFRALVGAQKEFTLSLLAKMFPKISEYKERADIRLNPHEEEAAADKQRRICHPSYFMIYFSLHVPEGYYSTKEFEGTVTEVNAMNRAGAEHRLDDYVKDMTAFKRMRFLERVITSPLRFEPSSAKALATAVARESHLLEADDFGIGDFASARRAVLVIANRFRNTDEITEVLSDVIRNASSDGFAQSLLQIATDRNHNKIIEEWAHVNDEALKAEFAVRMKSKYFKNSPGSIYDAPTRYDWQALFSWYRISPDDVREYLTDEFERRPANIGKHLFWLWPSVTHSAESKKVVDDLFPLAKLKELASTLGPRAYSTDAQQKVIGRLLTDDMRAPWFEN